jgi:YidC/Oxa1 family membrane protein insertase
MEIFNFLINKPLGFILGSIYNLVQSYGLSILLFTVVIKVIMLPLSVKQQKSMVNTARLQPKIKELEKKHKGDRQKQSEELMKLYQSEGVNPASGCLPMLIQLPIIYGLYSVINRPLSYLLGLTSEQIANISDILNLGYKANEIGMKEIYIAEAMKNNVSSLPAQFANLNMIDFNFYGLNLASSPSISQISPLWIIPILAGITAFLSSYVTTKISPSAASMGNNQAASMTKSMMYTMPLISIWITFTMPAGVGLYWIMSNILMVVQQYLLNGIIPIEANLPKQNKGEKQK